MPIHKSNLLNTGKAVTITNPSTDNTISIVQNGNVGTDVATDGAIHINNTGNTGIGIGVYSNQSTPSSELISIKTNNSGFDKSLLTIFSAGESDDISITHNNVGGSAINCVMNGGYSKGIVLSSGDNIYSVGILDISLKNGTDDGDCVRLSHVGDGAHINFSGDTANTSSEDGDFWFNGTDFKVNIADTVYKFDLTAI